MDAQQIKDLRKAYMLTQSEFAKKLGTTRVTVTRWETGAHPPTGEYLKRLQKLAGEQLDAKKEVEQLKASVRYWKKKYSDVMVDKATRHINKDVHKIYRQLAAKYHPDTNPNGEEFMKDINSLWEEMK